MRGVEREQAMLQSQSFYQSGRGRNFIVFSATITCASTIGRAWRSADIVCAALRSAKASKLPGSVLPSTAIAVSPSTAGGARKHEA